MFAFMKKSVNTQESDANEDLKTLLDDDVLDGVIGGVQISSGDDKPIELPEI
ncbi:MAG: hypothetical protein UHS51_04780 [Atopobiaceae bacterium]|jgi:hypothetical protein|nr:hypothetical protein [Atopobiaceae bacterium]